MPRLKHKPSYEEPVAAAARSTSPMSQDIPQDTSQTHSSSEVSDIRTSLRSLLFSLLVSTPPTLHPSQLSSDLTMRHRMLSLPPHPPLAHDSVEPSVQSGALPSAAYLSISDDERTASQHALISYLSRPPIELSTDSVDVASTAMAFFLKRTNAIRIALDGEEDPVKMERFELLCDQRWHERGRVLVRWPRESGVEGRLYLMIKLEVGEVKLDNLFALKHGEEEVGLSGLHSWTPECGARERDKEKGKGKGKQRAISEEQQGEGDAGAEYINDANDFWAGFSDEDQSEDEGEEVGEVVQTGAVSSGVRTGEGVNGFESSSRSEQQKAIQDIIRGAYTLHRSQLVDDGIDPKDSFVDMVLRTIS